MGMEAHKVRIGNHVYDTKGNRNVIDLEAIIYMAKEPLNQVKPIRLDESDLIKAGYKIVNPRMGVMGAYKFRNIRINLSNSGNFYFNNHVITYLHDFQNFHFSLFREEATV